MTPQTCARSSRPYSLKNSMKPGSRSALVTSTYTGNRMPSWACSSWIRVRSAVACRSISAAFCCSRSATLMVTITPLIGRARPILLQQAQETRPGGLVDLLVAFLRRVAARGVEEHRFVGEPPVAVARAADPADLSLARSARPAGN